MCLLLGDARLAFENYEEPSVAGVFELGVADCDVILNCRGQRRLEVRRLLQRGEDRCCESCRGWCCRGGRNGGVRRESRWLESLLPRGLVAGLCRLRRLPG